MSRYLAFALVAILASTSLAEEIPLKSIWAWGMPNVQRVTDIDPEVVKELKRVPNEAPATALAVAARLGDKSLTYKFIGSLKALDGKPGFAVSGHATEALRNAANTPLDAIPERLPEGNITLVFSAPQSRDRVRIEKVIRTGNKIEIRYVLTSRGGSYVDGDYFALIPLGKLSSGKYEVDITSEQKDRRSARHVSKPFSFIVE